VLEINGEWLIVVITFPYPMGFKTVKAALGLNPKPAFRFRSAANAIALPNAKPRAMREHFVVSSIRSREVARAQRPGIGHCEDALKVLDFDDSSVNVHAAQIWLHLRQAY
jgi:hypothetical protein